MQSSGEQGEQLSDIADRVAVGVFEVSRRRAGVVVATFKVNRRGAGVQAVLRGAAWGAEAGQACRHVDGEQGERAVRKQQSSVRATTAPPP